MNLNIKLGFFLEITVIGIASTFIVKDGEPILLETVVQVVDASPIYTVPVLNGP